MGEGKIIKIYNQGVSEVITVMKKMDNNNKELKAKLDALEHENNKLNKNLDKYEKQKNKNSSNSSKPPSTDGIGHRTKSLRKKSGKKPGGQKEHKGSTLELKNNPDEIKVLKVDKCSNCGANLMFIKNEGYEIRQKIDLLESQLKTIEYRAEKKTCPNCKGKSKGNFPKGVDKSVQYGESIKAFAVYLSKHQMIPYKRLKEIFSDMFNLKISTGTLVNFNKQCFKLLKNVEINIKQALIDSKILHSDETGVKSAGKLQWVHVATNNDFTHYGFHPKRGKDAINEIGILPYFKNILVHDCFSSYNIYTEATHVMCGAHILRELNGITELEKQSWSQEFFNHLVYIKKCIEGTIEVGKNSLDFKLINEIILKYDDILNNGRLEDRIINAKFYADLTHSKKDQPSWSER